VHHSIFISVINQFDAQNFVLKKVYFMPLHVSSICAHHQEVKTALYKFWYHNTYRWPSREYVAKQPVHETATYRCDDTRGCVMLFWTPGDEHMCSKHVGAWNKLFLTQTFAHGVGLLLR